jgi:hypothetical protein
MSLEKNIGFFQKKGDNGDQPLGDISQKILIDPHSVPSKAPMQLFLYITNDETLVRHQNTCHGHHPMEAHHGLRQRQDHKMDNYQGLCNKVPASHTHMGRTLCMA